MARAFPGPHAQAQAGRKGLRQEKRQGGTLPRPRQIPARRMPGGEGEFLGVVAGMVAHAAGMAHAMLHRRVEPAAHMSGMEYCMPIFHGLKEDHS